MFNVVDGRCVECGAREMFGVYWTGAEFGPVRHRDGCLAHWQEVHGIVETMPRRDRCVCDAPEGATAVAHIDRGCTVGRPFFCTVLVEEGVECGRPATEAERFMGETLGYCRGHAAVLDDEAVA